MDWFTVDKAGLAKIVERKGKEFVVFELLQNSWDEDTTHVEIEVKRVPNSPYVEVVVKDDSPDGFKDLSHAFTLFADSYKKGSPEKRGRFNLGEKLTLALCRTASITSTKGSVIFNEHGRHKGRANTHVGSIFRGELKMTNAEIGDIRAKFRLLLPPTGIKTCWYGDGGMMKLEHREPLTTVEEALPTEIADAEGNLRRSTRKTKIEIHSSDHSYGAWLYELGIPVVKIEDGAYSVNVMQKIPLNMDRDNVSPAYISAIHALTLNAVHDRLTHTDANSAWAKVAVQEHGDDLSVETVRKIANLRFGQMRVAYDPSDPEANNIAASKGYTVIHGGTMSAAEWSAMRRADAILPAGKVTPSRPENFVAAMRVPEEKWTSAMSAVANFCKLTAPHLIDCDVSVVIVNNPTASTLASYVNRQVTFNMGRLGKKWFEGPPVKIIDLIIHELAHEKSGNHLSEAYYDALTEIGAKMTMLALTKRDVFEGLGVRPHFSQAELQNV